MKINQKRTESCKNPLPFLSLIVGLQVLKPLDLAEAASGLILFVPGVCNPERELRKHGA
jgi:hypothetical protein